jgi:hypothetical protein
MCQGAHVHVVAGTDELITKRLRLRPWTGDDADAALAIFGRREVARWLTPAIPRVTIRDDMRQLLARWITEHDEAGRPLGHWAIEIRDSGLVIGAVSLLPLPPGCTDLEIGWQVTPQPGVTVTALKPATQWRIRLSPTEYRRCSPSCARATPAVWRPHGASEWSGSARPTSTTASRCNSTASPHLIWTIPNPPRAGTDTDSPASHPFVVA